MNKWSLIFWREENSVSCVPTDRISSAKYEVDKVYPVKWNRKIHYGQIAGLGSKAAMQRLQKAFLAGEFSPMDLDSARCDSDPPQNKKRSTLKDVKRPIAKKPQNVENKKEKGKNAPVGRILSISSPNQSLASTSPKSHESQNDQSGNRNNYASCDHPTVPPASPDTFLIDILLSNQPASSNPFLSDTLFSNLPPGPSPFLPNTLFSDPPASSHTIPPGNLLSVPTSSSTDPTSNSSTILLNETLSPVTVASFTHCLPSPITTLTVHPSIQTGPSSVEEIIMKYPKLHIEAKIGRLAVKLSREAIFGDQLMRQCTVKGCRGLPALPSDGLKVLKHALLSVFPQYRNSTGFESWWASSLVSVGQCCKRLRHK